MTAQGNADPLKAALLRRAARHGGGGPAPPVLPPPATAPASPKLPPLSFAQMRLKARLLAAAQRRCERLGDGPQAREAMRRECLEVPVAQWEDLLAYFVEDLGGG